MTDHELALDLEELRRLHIAKRTRIINHLNLLSKHLLLTEPLISEKEPSPPPPPPQSSQPQAKAIRPQKTVFVRKEVQKQEQRNRQLNPIMKSKPPQPSQPQANFRLQNTEAKKEVPKQEEGNSQLNLNPNQKSKGTMTIPQFRKEYGGLIKNGEHRQNITQSLHGQIMDIRSSPSSRIIFYDLQSGASKVQVVADPSHSDVDESEFSRLHSYVRRGDFVGATGFPGKSNRGDLSIFLSNFHILSKSEGCFDRKNNLFQPSADHKTTR